MKFRLPKKNCKFYCPEKWRRNQEWGFCTVTEFLLASDTIETEDFEIIIPRACDTENKNQADTLSI